MKKSTSNDDQTTTTTMTTTTASMKKRLSTMENENTKKLKVTNEESSQSDESMENHFSLNQFYLNKFLLILSSVLQYHSCLFDENELILFQKFQTLSGTSNLF